MEVVLTPVNQAHHIPISLIAHLLGDSCLQNSETMVNIKIEAALTDFKRLTQRKIFETKQNYEG